MRLSITLRGEAGGQFVLRRNAAHFFWNKIKNGSYEKLEVIYKIMREPLIAGILSFLVPGVGQIYNGRVVVGILWLVLTGISWIGSAGTLGWIVHFISAWCAYSYAKDHPIR